MELAILLQFFFSLLPELRLLDFAQFLALEKRHAEDVSVAVGRQSNLKAATDQNLNQRFLEDGGFYTCVDRLNEQCLILFSFCKTRFGITVTLRFL